MDGAEITSNIYPDRAGDSAAAPALSIGSRDDLERELADLWARVLDLDAVGMRDSFLHLGGDSISAIDLLQSMHSAYGLMLPPAELMRCGTIEHCAALIRAGSRPDRGSLVVPLNPKGSGPPLYLVHDITGELLSYTHLVRHLGADREVHGIQARDFEGTEPFRSFEEQAAFYVEALRAARPRSPFVLGGYSQGGPVAYEMARQLRGSEAEVHTVVIIDASNYNPTPPLCWDAGTLTRALANVPTWISDELFHMTGHEFHRRLQLQRSRFARMLRGRLEHIPRLATVGRKPSPGEPSSAKQVTSGYPRFIEANYSARWRYFPGPYPGRVVLIRGRTQPLTYPHRHDLGWGSPLDGRLEIRVVPGGHNLLLPPFVARVAEELRDILGTDGVPG